MFSKVQLSGIRPCLGSRFEEKGSKHMEKGREIKEIEDQKTNFAYFSQLSGALQELLSRLCRHHRAGP